MHRRFMLTLALAAATLFLVPAQSAFSATDTPAEPPASLTEEELVGLGDAFSVAVEELSASGTSARGCRSVVSRYVKENVFGYNLWAYHQRLDWCWRGGRITSANPRCTGTTPLGPWYLWWDFKGHIACWYGGGVGNTYVMRKRQGKWQYCPPRVGCIQTVLPIVWVRGNGDGTYTKGATN
jgi:hypothetical protein